MNEIMSQTDPGSKTDTGGADLREMGQMVRKARTGSGTTLEELAARAGISKSVLSQVERGLTNPTLATVWAIAGALKLDPLVMLGQAFDRSGDTGHADGRIARKQVPVIENKGEGYRLSILNKPELAGQVEIYQLELVSGGALVSTAHSRGAVEDFTLLDGQVEIASGHGRMDMWPGETVTYAADVDHAIRSSQENGARGILVVTYSS